MSIKKKRVFSVFICASLIGLTLAGCSTTGAKAGNGEAKIELFTAKSENVNILKSIASDYESKNPKVKITITAPGSNNSKAVIKTRLAKNDIPDIISMGGDATYTELQSAGVLEDLSNEKFASNLQESYKKMIYDVQANKEEKLYGAPYATNASGVLYNKDIFEKNGVKVPKTWDEFLTVCKTLKDKGVQPFEFTFKEAWTSLCAWNSMSPDLAPANFTSDKLAGKTTFAATHTEVVTKYLQLMQYGQKDMVGTSYDDGNKAFAEGKAAMMINGNWVIPEFKKTNKDIKVDLFALPASNDTSKNYVTSGVDVLFSVSKKSANIDAAKKFLEYVMDPTVAQKYIDDQAAFCAIKGVEQKDASVAGVKDDIAAGKVANFPDHYYPSGFDLSPLTQNLAKNAQEGMDATKNTTDFLAKCDKDYDASK